jgi:hypothetical protein
MKKQKKYLVYLLISCAIIVVFCVSYYAFFKNPYSARLKWVSEMYGQCIASSSEVQMNTSYHDIQEVLEGNYDAKKNSYHAAMLKEFAENGCKQINNIVCANSYLYLSRAFLARSNDKDLKLALTMLDLYKKSQGIDLYYDLVYLRVALSNGLKNNRDEYYYKRLISEIDGFEGIEKYFNSPHEPKICNLYLEYISSAYSRSGNYASDLYIQTHILKK